MRKTLATCLLVLMSFVGAFSQERRESQVIDLGDGYQAKLVEQNTERFVFVKFPDTALKNKDAFAAAVLVSIEKVFVPDNIKNVSEIKLFSAYDPKLGKYRYFDYPNNRIVITSLYCGANNEKVCGVVFLRRKIPPII